MQRPLVSIITPTYNSAAFIGATVESVLGQTYQAWEMLIVDDASTDSTKEVIKDYSSADSRISFFQFDRNSGGPAAPRNFGIHQAKGSLVAFLDSDDLWLPAKLEKSSGLVYSLGPPARMPLGTSGTPSRLHCCENGWRKLSTP